MSLNYVTAPTSAQSNTSGIYLLEEGVTVDASSSFSFAFFHSGSTHLTLQINGTAIETDGGGAKTVSLTGAVSSVVSVGTKGEVHSEGEIAVQFTGDLNQIVNYGLVTGRIGLYTYGTDNSISNFGRVEAVGTTTGVYGLALDSHPTQSGGSMVNAGVVTSDFLGVYLNSFNGTFDNSGKIIADYRGLIVGKSGAFISNSGLLRSDDEGIAVSVGATDVVIDNSGKIKATNVALDVEESITLLNSGSIISTSGTALTAGQFAGSEILNSGTIKGAIILSDATDTYVAQGKGMVKGTVFGEGGQDQLSGAKANDSFDGGDDNDVLTGKAGKDTLSGGAGTDFIEGGRGKDTLFGGGATGTGDTVTDYFLFFDKKVGTDRIKDFEDGVDQIQLDGYRMSGTVTDLLASALSENGAGDAVVDLSVFGKYKGKIVFEGVDMSLIDDTDFQVIL